MIAPETGTVPHELREENQWLMWGYEERDGKPTKVPYSPRTGRRADPTDPATWGSYEEALNALHGSIDVEELACLARDVLEDSWDGGALDVMYDLFKTLQDTPELVGVGFVFSEDDTFAGVDLDDCRDPGTGELDPEARRIVDALNSYTEVSPSGTGVKVFCRASKPGDKCRTKKTPWGGEIEMYDQGRFFTVTGQHLEGTPTRVKDSPRMFKALYEHYFGVAGNADDTEESEGYAAWSNGYTDDEVIAKLRAFKNTDKFARLYDHGDVDTYHGGDDSSADASLMSMLAFVTGPDPEQIERIMRRSGLARPKWNEPRVGGTWLRYDIDRLLAKREKEGAEYYTPSTRRGDSATTDTNFDSVQYSIPPKKKEIEFWSVEEVLAAGGDEPPWAVKPFLVFGGMSDLAGRAKAAGKTTLVLDMVRRSLDGKPFLGEPTVKSSVIYATEQGHNIAEGFKQAGINADHENLHIVPWRSTTGHKWPEIIDTVREKIEQVKEGAGLPVVLVVDTLNRFAGLDGEKENSAGDVMAVMNPLMSLAQDEGVAVLTIRHANKEGGARGSTAFDHDADILLTMGRPLGGYGPNVREIKGMGRYDAVPELLLVELTANGYTAVGTSADAAFKQAVASLRAVAPDNEGDALTEKELIDAMQESDGVSRSTGKRAIKFLSSENAKSLEWVGKGVKGDPYKYYIPGLGGQFKFNQGKKGEEDEKAIRSKGGGVYGPNRI